MESKLSVLVFRWGARIISTLLLLFILLSLISSFPDVAKLSNSEVLLFFPVILFVTSLILGWFFEIISGALNLFAALLFFAWIGIDNAILYIAFIPGIFYLMSGILELSDKNLRK